MMKKIYSYVDYRDFLKDRFAEMKSENKKVTHRHLMEKAGFTSPNFLKLVMEGQRNLSEKSMPKIAEIMGIEGKEYDFFVALVRFNQAKDFKEKDKTYNELTNLRYDIESQRLEHQQFDYFKNWYTVAIRELIDTHDFKEDIEWIHDRLKKEVSPAKVRKTINYLEELGLLKRKRGKLTQAQNMLSSGNDVSLLAVYRFHSTMIKKALEALDHESPDHYDISGATFTISKKNFKEIKKLIQNFRRSILTLADNDNEAEDVYQLNIQFFNLTKV